MKPLDKPLVKAIDKSIDKAKSKLTEFAHRHDGESQKDYLIRKGVIKY